jgi:hypothetical protein
MSETTRGKGFASSSRGGAERRDPAPLAAIAGSVSFPASVGTSTPASGRRIVWTSADDV